MDAKLTLKLDKTIIDSAKKYARENNRSLSRMVEHYFSSLLPESEHSRKQSSRHSSIVASLTGVLSEGDLEKIAREDERARYIIKREI